MAGILARRRRAERDAREHLEASRAQRDEVEQVAEPLRRQHQRNHLADQVYRGLRGNHP